MVNNNSTIETVRDTTENLYQLLDLMFAQFKEMEPGQAESLIGLSLELASQVSSWAIAEEKRRNG
ncbi:hypothetical protein TUM17576_41890 [Enterobacter hormaechei]|nr:hypothetical protein [Enterobacter hormaechei]GJL37369.1 hypothetical protein TUM17576_41890 [Enterobacter hormaechei]